MSSFWRGEKYRPKLTILPGEDAEIASVRKEIAGLRLRLLYLLRKKVEQRDGTECYYCGSDTVTFPSGSMTSAGDRLRERTLDHKIPTVQGGPDSLDNLVISCRSCNSSKGTRSYAQFKRLKA